MSNPPVAVVTALTRLGLVSSLGFTLLAGLPVAAETQPYPKALAFADKSAHAVLARAGRETCLRGKLTKALLGLSNSCEAAGMTTPLCRLADKAVIVTPMSLAFMDQTSRQLLDLIAGGSGVVAPSATSTLPSSPEPAVEP